MSESSLSPDDLRRGRRAYYVMSAFTVIGVKLLGVNIITLYALRLGAGNSLVGLLYAFNHLSFIFILIGRAMVKRMGAVRLMGMFWTIRFLLMTPILLLAVPAVRESFPLNFIVMGISVFGLRAARGIAMASNKPIQGELAGEKEKSGFISANQIITHTMSIGMGLLMGVLLGSEAPIHMYSVFIAAGIVLGLVSAYFVFRIPEPRKAGTGFGENLWTSLRNGWKAREFRKLIIVQFLRNFTISMITPFLIVYFKKVYFQPDSAIVFLIVIGGTGSVAMALLVRFFIDRVGAKPLFFASVGIVTISLVPLVLSPAIASPFLLWLFPGAVYFLFHMGTAGMVNSAQNYFLEAVEPKGWLNLGTLYIQSLALSGFVGSLLGGVILDGMQKTLPMGETAVFQLYFGVLTVLVVVVSVLVYQLPDIGALSIRQTLSIIFSPRALNSIRLLRKLDRSKTSSEERQVLEAMRNSPSEVTVEGLLEKLNSPSFFVRTQALMTLRNLSPDKRIVRHLLSEVKNHQFTTAHMAAQIIGDKRIKAGIPVLVRALGSEDYFLCGKSMVALAELGHLECIPHIKRIFGETQNPRLIIHGAKALEIFREVSAIPLLMGKLEDWTSPFLRDEIILALSGILGISDWFYSLYASFLERGSRGMLELDDYISVSTNDGDSQTGRLKKLIRHLVKKRDRFPELAVELLKEFPIQVDGTDTSLTFIEALGNPKVARLERFRFLTAAAMCRSHIPGTEGGPNTG